MADVFTHPGRPPMDSKRSRAPGSQKESRPNGRATGVSLGKIFGIQVMLDYSLLVIGFLVTFNLGVGLLPAWHPEWPKLLSWSVAFAAAVSFIASVLAHELSHAIVGRKVGVPISAITLFLFGGMAHMEAEPKRPRAEFLTAIVGPLTSLAIGITATLLAIAVGPGEIPSPASMDVGVLQQFGPVATLLLWLGPINILLGLFNLVPGFPLDGGRVLRSVLWWATGSFERATRLASLAGQAVAWALIGSGVAMMLGYRIPFFGVGFVPGLWSVILGWFLNTAAKRSYEQVVVSSALDRVAIRRLMLSQFEAVAPETHLDDLVYQRLLHSDQRSFPVLSRDGQFLGLVSLTEARRVAEGDWASTNVANVMTPRDELSVLEPDEQASAAMRLFSDARVEQIPILEGGVRLVGLLRRQDLVKWFGVKAAAESARSA